MLKGKTQLMVFPIVLCIAAMLTACRDAEGGIPEEQAEKPCVVPEEERTLISVMKEESYTPDEFLAHLGAPSMIAFMNTVEIPFFNVNEFANSFARVKLLAHQPRLDSLFAAEVGTESNGTRRWHFESYTFTYQSVTSYGQRIEMSGRVTFPNNTVDGIGHEVSTLTLHSHQELPYADCAPSENLMFMTMRAMYNSAVIEPDFQNCGINDAKVMDGTGSSKAMTRQLVDCVIAALEVMYQHGVELAPDGHATNWGSSKNLAVPIGFAKYYETEAPQWFRNAVRLGSTFAGEGPYDLSELIPYYFQHPEYYPVALYFMCYMSGLTASQLGGYELKDLLSPWLYNQIYTIGDKDYTLPEAISLGRIKVFTLVPDPLMPEITRPDQVLAPDLLTPDGLMDVSNPKVKVFLNGMSEAGNVFDWEPTLPIYFAHCPYDKAIDYNYARQAYLRFSKQGTNPALHWIDVPYPESLVEPILELHPVGVHAMVSFFMHVYMSCVEEPEDMRKVYN